MGHTRLGVLPATRKWKQVIGLIAGGADVEHIAAETSAAAEDSLADAARDPALRHSFWLLTQIPLAAKSDNFADALARHGVYVSPAPLLPEICCAFMACVDRQVQSSKGRTDLGEMAELSAVESLNAVAGRELPGLAGTTDRAEDTRIALQGLATGTQFGVLARDFFARLTRRYLDYYLGRELPKHVGMELRFHSIREHREFDQALETHCRESAVIAQEFSSDWFSSQTYQGGIDQRKAGRFVYVAFEKIQKELRWRRHATH